MLLIGPGEIFVENLFFMTYCHGKIKKMFHHSSSELRASESQGLSRRLGSVLFGPGEWITSRAGEGNAVTPKRCSLAALGHHRSTSIYWGRERVKHSSIVHLVCMACAMCDDDRCHIPV